MTQGEHAGRIYFPFADGAFGYDCRECGGKCCTGFGFGYKTEEYERLVERYPTLVYFARPYVAGVVGLNYQPRCFFQRDTGACAIHEECGFDAKPVVCRTFPVTKLLLAGSVLVPNVHFLCPLRKPRPGDLVIRHDELTENIMLSFEHVLQDAVQIQPGATLLDGNTDEIIDYEQWCRDEAPRLAGDDIIMLSAVFRATAPSYRKAPDIAPSAKQLAGMRRRQEDYLQRLVRFLSAAQYTSVVDTDLDAQLSIMSPRIRLLILAIHEFSYQSYEEVLRLFPNLICVIWLYMKIAAATNDFPVNLSTISQLVEKNLIAFILLAHLDDIPLIDPMDEELVEVGFEVPYFDMVEKLIRFIYQDNFDRRLSLQAILDVLGITTLQDKLFILQSVPDGTLKFLRFVPTTTR